MESKQADGGFSRDALEKELADRKPEELQEMAKRLTRSTDGLQQMMLDLEAEKESLRAENQQLNETISMMMQEMRKLNIGADNCVEPMLEEGPLAFVGRFWEQVKPRDNTYLVNDNVGEIMKAEPGEEDHSPNDLGKHVERVQERAKEVGQRLQGALGPLWSRAEGLIKDAQEELQSQVAAQRERQAQSSSSSKGREMSSSGGYPAAAAVAGTWASFASKQQGFAGLDSLLAKGHDLLRGDRGPRPAPASASACSSDAPKQEASAEVALKAPEAPAELPAAEAKASQEVAEKPAVQAEKTNAAAGKPAVEAVPEELPEAQPEEQISSTVLIEATITLEDGSAMTLQVRAADRCKEVAAKFVQEHNLKAWFQAPLTAWLKKVEADAVKFPVRVEGDLLEIRKTHSKK